MKLTSPLLILTAGLCIGFSVNAFACGESTGGGTGGTTPPACTPNTHTTYDFVSHDGSTSGNTADLRDLPHGSYFTWGIQWTLPTNETITGATLTFKKIYDTDTSDTQSTLYTNLLDFDATHQKPTSNSYSGSGYTSTLAVGDDHNEVSGDHFDSNGYTHTNLQDLTDIVKNKDNAIDRVISFSGEALNALTSYLSDGVFGLGIDPDCHFIGDMNNGVTLSITTLCQTNGNGNPEPVPEPASMLLLGSGLVGLASLRARRKK